MDAPILSRNIRMPHGGFWLARSFGRTVDHDRVGKEAPDHLICLLRRLPDSSPVSPGTADLARGCWESKILYMISSRPPGIPIMARRGLKTCGKAGLSINPAGAVFLWSRCDRAARWYPQYPGGLLAPWAAVRTGAL